MTRSWSGAISPEGIPIWRKLEATPPPVGVKHKAGITIVGTGPVGLALAIDLGMRGHAVTVLGLFEFVPGGSKAICFSKRSLDILDRLGVGEAVADKGVTWNTGKVFWQDRPDPVFQFDLQPAADQKMPGFVNLQQYHVEDLLLERLADMPNVEIRWGHKIAAVVPEADTVELFISTAEGDYALSTDWLIACDGSRSTVRDSMGLEFVGRMFEDNFLIADIKMKGEWPSERWFWFDPPFNPGQSALMHKQPDDIWRLDFQLGWDIDKEECIKPENVDPLIRAMLGEDIQYEPEWYSVYTFQCRRLERFVHDRVIFAGDSAHLVSPFGARGCNGGLADIDNLGWKLDLILRGDAKIDLLESYNQEALITADENILNSSRSTDFLTPKSAVSETFRDAVLHLATEFPFARGFVNSGRLSTAVHYPDGPLNTLDDADWTGGVVPGSPALDAPLDEAWLLEKLGGRFVVLADQAMSGLPEGVEALTLSDFADSALVKRQYAIEPGSAYLIRPDQYVAARYKQADPDKIRRALERARGVAA